MTALPALAGFAADDWASLNGASRRQGAAYNPFVSHAFLSALEESGSIGGRSGWSPLHLRLDDASGGLLAAVPCYVKDHSQGEYVFDHGWADAYARAGGAYYPKLQVAVPFTPATGPRLLARADAPAATRAMLARGLEALAGQTQASSAHATFLDDIDRAAFADAGWLARTDQQFHFANPGYRDYGDFLSTLASRKRKALKKERDAARHGVDIAWLTGKELTEAVWDDFFAFYMDTGSRKWGRPYLNRRFFSLIGATMADDILLVVARRDGRAIAGALNFIGGEALYGRYWGAVEDRPFLHFELCYHQAIDFALDKGLKRVEAGAQGEHKLARGYLPVTTHSAHFIAHPGLRDAVARYLVHEREQIAEIGEALASQGPYRKA
ncbi:MAG: N-acetyltransferase [Phyllobacteriaceae bacterium]|nr:N-acetyltransferase [Phyllobacteriaceae bacterium]